RKHSTEEPRDSRAVTQRSSQAAYPTINFNCCYSSPFAVLLLRFARTLSRELHISRLPATLQIQADAFGCAALSGELKPLQNLETPKFYTTCRTVMSTLRLTIDGRTFRDSDSR